jgi:hypothetical protein
VRQEWRAVLKWGNDCEEGFESPDGKFGGVRFYRLQPSIYLVEVTCTRGSYQGSQSYFVWDERAGKEAARGIEFVTYEVPRDKLEKTSVKELWGTAQFDARRRTLTVENRHRGPGDCGSRAVYRMSAGGATLIEFRAKVECDGRESDPRRWPLVPLTEGRRNDSRKLLP